MAWAIFSMLFLAIGGVVVWRCGINLVCVDDSRKLADVYESGRGRLEVYNSGI